MSKDKDTLVPMTELLPMWFSRRGMPAWWPFGGEDMRLEEFREKDTMVVRAELPGLDPDKDIEVSVRDGMLHIHAHRTEKSEHEDDRSYRSEFTYGLLSRDLVLPAGVTGKDAVASYHDGILEVRVPVNGKAAKAEKVAISRS